MIKNYLTHVKENKAMDPFEDDFMNIEIEYDNLNIGDKVLCQDPSLSKRLLELKKTYIIIDIKRGQHTQIRVSGIKDEWWEADRFEKI